MYRGTHVKTQGCVKGTFKVKEGLPVYLRQGMFKDPSALSAFRARTVTEGSIFQRPLI